MSSCPRCPPPSPGRRQLAEAQAKCGVAGDAFLALQHGERVAVDAGGALLNRPRTIACSNSTAGVGGAHTAVTAAATGAAVTAAAAVS